MKWLFLILVASIGLLGCGGSGSAQPAKGELVIDMDWAHYNASGDALARAASVRIEVLQAPDILIATAIQNRPNPIAVTGMDIVASSWAVFPNFYSLRVTAFDGPDGSGVRLGQRVLPISFGVGQRVAGIGCNSISLD